MISLAFLLFAVLFFLSVILAGCRIMVFWDVPSFLFILSGVAGYFLLFGRKEFARGVKTFFAFSFPPDDHASESSRFFLHLSSFTLSWGFFGMILGTCLALLDLDPDKVGYALGISLLSFLYASALALFVFLPIGLRLSPPTLPTLPLPKFWQFSFWHLLVGFGAFYLLRCLVVIVALAVPSAQSGNFPTMNNDTEIVFRLATFAFNPADPAGDYYRFDKPLAVIAALWNGPSLILVVGSWRLFRLASGKRRKWMGAPVIILIGVFWSAQGFVLTLSNFRPDVIAVGFMICTLTLLYGLFGAVYFLISDSVRSGDCNGVPFSSPALLEGETEQAKEIIDNAVKNVRR